MARKGAPGRSERADTDKPTLTIYRASRRVQRHRVAVAPGGGNTNLAVVHAGRQVASCLTAMGGSAFVLKYRLGPRDHHPIELGDAQRAIRIVRSRAQELNVLPDRVGIMGFSAGGHLASTAATHFDNGKADAADPIDRAGCRPDFLILGYPVISTDPAIAHAGSVRNLLGENPDPKLLEDMSNDLRVTAQTPPTFIFQTNADTTVVAENSVRFYLALRKAKVPAEMHIFENGPHGSGCRSRTCTQHVADTAHELDAGGGCSPSLESVGRGLQASANAGSKDPALPFYGSGLTAQATDPASGPETSRHCRDR